MLKKEGGDDMTTRTTTQTRDASEQPLEPGWLVVYRGRRGRTPGNKEGWTTGTVKTLRACGTYWKVVLSNGDRPPLSAIVNVGRIAAAGAVWTGPAAARGVGGEGA
jgi:hypothetical protein